MKKVIGIIGFGNMGSAIAERAKTQYKVAVFDKDIEKTKHLKGIKVFTTILELIKNSDVIILAVKPQDLDGVLGKIKDYVDNKLVVSIAAGVLTRYIEKNLGKVKVVRVMPNLPAKFGKGMSCIAKGKFVQRGDIRLVEKIFNKVGKTKVINENLMDAATAVSGSGPGFYFVSADVMRDKYEQNRNEFTEDFILYLINAAREAGFNYKDAKLLATTTGTASEYMVVNSRVAPAELGKQVTSKGGTTEAGLIELKGNPKNLTKAVKAALKRAKELSKKER